MTASAKADAGEGQPAKQKSRVVERHEAAAADHAAAVAEVERLEGRKTSLAEETAADEAMIAGLRNAATETAITGGTVDANAIVAAEARLNAKSKALAKVDELLAAAQAEQRRAAGALDEAGRLLEMHRVALWIRAAAPALADLLAAVAAIDPQRRHGISDALGQAIADPAAGVAMLERLRNTLRRRVVNALTPVVSVTREPPPADTFIKSSRPFSFEYQGAGKISAPAGWVGRVPRGVATRLVKESAARILPALVIVETEGADEFAPISGGAKFRRKRRVPMTRDEATAAVAKGTASVVDAEAREEDYAAYFAAEPLFWKGPSLDLGRMDAMPREPEILEDEDGEILPEIGHFTFGDWTKLYRLALNMSGPPPVVGPVDMAIVPMPPALPASNREKRKRLTGLDPEAAVAISKAAGPRNLK